MEPDGIHELTAAYALNALDPDDEREYEEHLRRCDRCRDDLASLQEAAGSLAYDVETPDPPKRLRESILAQATSERANVIQLRRRWLVPALGAVAAVAAGVAIGLGVWSSSLSGSLSEKESALVQQSEVLALFAGQGGTHFPVSGADGTLVVAPGGEGALVLTNLSKAPEGMTYEAWVIEGDEVQAAGTFDGGDVASVVRLTQPVPLGATVAVTIEPAGGVEEPTTKPFAIAPTV